VVEVDEAGRDRPATRMAGMAYDLVIRNGTVFDGTGGAPSITDLAIAGDRIAAVGSVPADAVAGTTIDAAGLAVAPGFVNVLSHSYSSILVDPRSLSELKQGVTTQIFGEGQSMGPWTTSMRDAFNLDHRGWGVTASWMRIAEHLAHCEHVGVSQNVASFIGATTLRIHAVGHDDRPASDAELDVMRSLAREEMADGALGIASALIYPPAFFASTDELVAVCDAVAPYGGSYISHLRSEGADLLGALDELLEIARRAGVPAEVYHLKAIGRSAWPSMDGAIERIESARDEGLAITADVYPYTAGGTSLASSIPPWFHDGGTDALLARLGDASTRAAVCEAIRTSVDGWENLYLGCGGGEGVLLLSIRDRELRVLQGRTIACVAEERGADPVETLVDLVRRDPYIGAAYFMISEDNLRRQLALPWVSIGSDAASQASEGVFVKSSTHPRSYGTFARVLGHYVRDEGVLTLAEAVRRMTSLPADNLGLRDRGRIEPGRFADVAVFDPATIADTATYDDPHQYAEGVHHVIVNGVLTLRDGTHTGAFGGRALRRGA
jgi:N-acyl-D-amino-acid deacylase